MSRLPLHKRYSFDAMDATQLAAHIVRLNAHIKDKQSELHAARQQYKRRTKQPTKES